jgi:hypothetical protein
MQNEAQLPMQKPSFPKRRPDESMLPAVRPANLLPMQPDGKKLQLPDRVSMQDALSGVVVATVIRHHGEAPVRNTLIMALAGTVDSLSCQQPSARDWMKLFVTDWVERYPTETIEDFQLFLKRVRLGEFGPLYAGRIDGHRLFEMFALHLENKADQRERQIRAERQRVEHPSPLDPEQQALMSASADGPLRLMSPSAAESLQKIKASLSCNNKPNKEAQRAADEQAWKERMQKGLAQVPDAETMEDLLSLMFSFPEQTVQLAVAARAEELGIALPTRDEIIASTKARAQNRR